MKAEKDNLKDEILHRLLLIEKSMQNLQNDEMLYLILSNEHSQNTEFLNLINIFENRLGFADFTSSKFTPILDYKTKEPLKIGDRVENYNKQCGILHFDDCFNKYVIKTDTGGHINSTVYIKIPELYDYKIDSSRVECRSSNKFLKKRW